MAKSKSKSKKKTKSKKVKSKGSKRKKSKKKDKKTKKSSRKKKKKSTKRKSSKAHKKSKERKKKKKSGKKPSKKSSSGKKKTDLSFKKRLKLAFSAKRFKAFALLAVSLTALSIWLFWDIPLPTEIAERRVPVSTKLFDRNGKLIFEIYTDKRSTPVDIEELPDHVVNATIAIEDKDFYKHYGVSIEGIARAAYKTLFKKKLEGGSTLTQQLVKNTLLTPERTIRRKLRELALTIFVETIYTKEEILELYLNQIPYGGTAYGIGAASELYFDKPATELTLAESALLAGLPAAPTRFSPFGARPGLSEGRQKAVLRRMVEDGYITKEEMDKALEDELSFTQPEELKAPHFALWVKDQLAQKYGDVVVEQGGLRVTTTLDIELQEFAETAVATEVAKLADNDVGNGAALVTRPATGEVLAMVGSKDYFAEDEDGKVNIIFAERQPGSSIKPLNYALAIRDEKITPSTPLADVPTCFITVGQSAYCPDNYDFNFHGATQVRFALGNSYNIPAVRVVALNGIENLFDFAKEMGITTWTDPSDYGLSLTLGGGEVRPYDMAVAFGVLANGGNKVPLTSILKVEKFNGEVLEEKNLDEIEDEEVLDPGVAFLISHILQDNNARTAAFGSRSFLNVTGHPEVSVKTGTTNDLRDNWTVGYTPLAAVVTWVGNNDNSSMSRAVSGVSGASPIWNRIMREVLDKAENGYYDEDENEHAWPEQPDNIVGTSVCTTTGNLPGGDENNPDCPTRFEYFLGSKVGAQIEAGARDLQIDRTTQALAHPELPPELIETQNKPFLLDPLGTLVCLDCPLHEWTATISYPIITNRSDDN